ncbi:MAG TPA: protein kinase [Kofleriaceae bacterium]|nr:protein kinase [Kofleriaceae bacterium]
MSPSLAYRSPKTAAGSDAPTKSARAGGSPEPGARLRCPTCLAPFRAVYSRCPKDGSPLAWSTVDPLIGTTIADRYVIEALVGEGAMGLVYRAHHARLSRLFALKLMFGDVAAEPAMRMRFAQEADVASRLSHPNVVSVCDFGKTERGLLYLAMDYVEGETLASLLRREGPLDEARVTALARQLARGLGHAHRAGLVHRDFKPANIAVATAEDGGELVRVLDFGLAISEREGDRIGRLTEHGLVVGTPIYISPEQAKDLPVDHRADLFAMGVVMYEMLTGRPPFEGTGPEIARANVTQKPPSFAHRNPNVRVAPELEQLVFKLLEKRPGERYQTAEDVIAALDRFERGATAVPSVTTEPAARRGSVLWLTGRGSRRAAPEAAAVSPGAPLLSAAPYPVRPDAMPPLEEMMTWDGADDPPPTIAMSPRPSASAPAQTGQRRRAAGWLGFGVVAALFLVSGHSPLRGGERPAQAAALPEAASDVTEIEDRMDASQGERCSSARHAEPTGGVSPKGAPVPRAARSCSLALRPSTLAAARPMILRR